MQAVSTQCASTDFPPPPACVQLQAADAKTFGSWLSRSWLSGLVLPGANACHLLMSTLVENDDSALQKPGETAYFCGGFVLSGRTWWSKACIVGRVFGAAANSTDCMGWINVPNIIPFSGTLRRRLSNGWIHVHADEAPSLRKHTRIHDGASMAGQSSPPGIGDGKVKGTEFRIPIEHAYDPPRRQKITFDSLTLTETRPRNGDQHRDSKASATFWGGSDNGEEVRIILTLCYDIYFISAQPCRLPHVDARLRVSDETEHLFSRRRNGIIHPLPSHPLHKSFRFVNKELAELRDSVLPPDHTDLRSEIWVLDARGSEDRQLFARAWCSQVGRHALVARTGRTWLSCCVREARAIDIGIVIRIGSSVR